MRRILAVIIVLLIAVPIFLLIYIPAQDFLRRILGPTIVGAFSGIGSMITGSALWRNVITAWPYSLAIGVAIGLVGMGIAAWLWHTGFNAFRRVMVRSAIQESGTGYREIKGQPISTSVTATQNPPSIKTEEPHPEPKPEKGEEA